MKWNETKYIISCSFNVVLKRFGQVVSPYVLTFIILRTEAGTEAVHRCTLGRFRGPNSSMVKEDFHPKNRPNRPFFYSLVKIGNSRCSTDIERPKNPINNLQGSPLPPPPHHFSNVPSLIQLRWKYRGILDAKSWDFSNKRSESCIPGPVR